MPSGQRTPKRLFYRNLPSSLCCTDQVFLWGRIVTIWHSTVKRRVVFSRLSPCQALGTLLCCLIINSKDTDGQERGSTWIAGAAHKWNQLLLTQYHYLQNLVRWSGRKKRPDLSVSLAEECVWAPQWTYRTEPLERWLEQIRVHSCFLTETPSCSPGGTAPSNSWPWNGGSWIPSCWAFEIEIWRTVSSNY